MYAMAGGGKGTVFFAEPESLKEDVLGMCRQEGIWEWWLNTKGVFSRDGTMLQAKLELLPGSQKKKGGKQHE